MAKVRMSQNVISYALLFCALLGCTSNIKANINTNIGQNLVPGTRSGILTEFNKSEIVPSGFSRFKRQVIEPGEDTTITTRKSPAIEYSDSDSPSNPVFDYEVAANPPDFQYDINPTIVNGTQVDPMSSDPIPYQLSIRFQRKPPFGPWQHLCGAVILDENTAITAAHCFGKSEDVSRYRVTAGENLLDVYEKQEQILQVQKIIIHPEYTDIINGHDIAILHVDKIQLNEHARGVWLSPFSTQKLSNLTGVISGWGKVSQSDAAQVSNSLQKGNVTILSPKDCHPRLRRLRVAVAGILCALDSNIRACNGDSGGPLVIQHYKLPVGNFRESLLVGIISFGAGKCDIQNSAGFFTEISYFYDWIQEERAKKPCEQNYLPCVSGGCFRADLKCDKNEDCADGTDEIECSGKNTIKTTTTAKTPAVLTPSSKPTNPQPSTITSCSDAMVILPTPISKKQRIYPHGNGNGTSVEVLCDFETDGGGWTIIQKRSSGPKQEFNRTWTEYVNGFGSLDKNVWLGLDNIHALTTNDNLELLIELEDFEGEKKWAKYSNFSISDVSDFYRLSISGFYENSTANDSLIYNSGMPFSTTDKDNDNGSGNCAEIHGGGGWWFNECSFSALNGLYLEKGEPVPGGKGIYWFSWKGWSYSLAKSEMKIRKKKS